MSTTRKILRKIFPISVGLVVLAGALGVAVSSGFLSTINGKPAVTAVESLLNVGSGDTRNGYFKATSSTLVAAAAGDYNWKFYDLGELLVKDGLSNTIIDL